MRRAQGVGLLVAACLALGVQGARAQPVEVENARRAVYEAASDTWLIEGEPVRLRRGDLSVQARWVRYRAREGTFEAEGQVQVVRADGLEVQARRAAGSVRDRVVRVVGDVRGTYPGPESPVLLQAARAEVDFHGSTARAGGGVRVSWAEAVLEAEEVSADGRSGELAASGHPVVTWRDARLVAAAVRADLRAAVARASGGVRLVHPTGTAEGQEAEVLWRQRVAVLRGRVVARRGADELRAEEVRYAWDRGVLTAEGRPRVVVHP